MGVVSLSLLGAFMLYAIFAFAGLNKEPANAEQPMWRALEMFTHIVGGICLITSGGISGHVINTMTTDGGKFDHAFDMFIPLIFTSIIGMAFLAYSVLGGFDFRNDKVTPKNILTGVGMGLGVVCGALLSV